MHTQIRVLLVMGVIYHHQNMKHVGSHGDEPRFQLVRIEKGDRPSYFRAMILQFTRGAFTHITADISFGLGLLGCGRVEAQDVLMAIPVAFATVSYSSYLIDLARNTINNLHMVMNFLCACNSRVHCRH